MSMSYSSHLEAGHYVDSARWNDGKVTSDIVPFFFTSLRSDYNEDEKELSFVAHGTKSEARAHIRRRSASKDVIPVEVT